MVGILHPERRRELSLWISLAGFCVLTAIGAVTFAPLHPAREPLPPKLAAAMAKYGGSFILYYPRATPDFCAKIHGVTLSDHGHDECFVPMAAYSKRIMPVQN